VLLVNWAGFPVFAAFAAGVLLASGVGLAVEFAVYRPLHIRRSSRLAIAISSFAAYLVLINVLAGLFSSQHGVVETARQTISVNGLLITLPQLFSIALATSIYLVMIPALKTQYGRAIRAMEDSEDLLRACGWNVLQLRTACILAGSAFGGLAGGLSALDTGVEPGMGMAGLLNALVIVVVAGTGSYRGLLPVALLLAFIQQVFGYVVSPRWESAVSFAVLTGFLIVSPRGLFAFRRRAEELV
jgi:branched-chain amino acid transport system permease protein